MDKNRRLVYAKMKKTKKTGFAHDFPVNPLQKSLWDHLEKRLILATIEGHIEQSVENGSKIGKKIENLWNQNGKNG